MNTNDEGFRFLPAMEVYPFLVKPEMGKNPDISNDLNILLN
jgi:hypothetical protein